MSRPVPRNIDKPNRVTEYVFTFLAVYYGLMFLTQYLLLSLTAAFFAVYFVNKVTMDKPEGQTYRLLYRYIKIGKMIPSPRFVKRFEV